MGWRIISLTMLIAALLSNPVTAYGSCFLPPSPELLHLHDLVHIDPKAAIAAINKAIEDTSHLKSIEDRTWLYALLSDSYWTLSDTTNQSKAATTAIKLGAPVTSPAYVAALLRYAQRDFQPKTLQDSIKILRSALANLPTGTPEYFCVQSSLGWVETKTGEYRDGAQNLIDAYKFSKAMNFESVTAETAQSLSSFMVSAKDYSSARDLIEESISYYIRKNYTFDIMDTEYFLALAFINDKKYAKAWPHLKKTEIGAKEFRDDIGMIFDQSAECSIQYGLKKYEIAEKICRDVGEKLKTVGPEELGENMLTRAHILFETGRIPESIEFLNDALRIGGKSINFHAPDAYKLRALAYEKMGDTHQSMKDLLKYIELRDTQDVTTNARLNMAKDAEKIFEQRYFDQAIRSEQLRSRVWSLIAGLLGSIGIIMLGIIAYVSLRRRGRIAKQMADRDALTGLYNRRAVETMLTERRARRQGRKRYAVALIDLDFFKSINDNFGHATGDVVLRSVATVFGEELNESDVVARWGGEEFVIISSRYDVDALFVVVEDLREKLKYVRFDGFPLLSASFSAGLCCMEPRSDLPDVLNKCDEALYKAKKSGRGCTFIWTDAGIVGQNK